jgi:hypothetical protein
MNPFQRVFSEARRFLSVHERAKDQGALFQKQREAIEQGLRAERKAGIDRTLYQAGSLLFPILEKGNHEGPVFIVDRDSAELAFGVVEFDVFTDAVKKPVNGLVVSVGGRSQPQPSSLFRTDSEQKIFNLKAPEDQACLRVKYNVDTGAFSLENRGINDKEVLLDACERVFDVLAANCRAKDANSPIAFNFEHIGRDGVLLAEAFVNHARASSDSFTLNLPVSENNTGSFIKALAESCQALEAPAKQKLTTKIHDALQHPEHKKLFDEYVQVAAKKNQALQNMKMSVGVPDGGAATPLLSNSNNGRTRSASNASTASMGNPTGP